MSDVWAEFDKTIDVKALAEEQNNASNGDYEDLPDGNYEVDIDGIEAATSKSGKPMVKVAFTLREGQKYAKRKLWMNQVIDTTFGLHKANEFLKSLELDCVADAGEKIFKNFKQYNNLLMDAAEEIESAGLYFNLKYTKQKNSDFHDFEIVEVYES